MFRNKKGVAEWISWVLLVALTVVVGVFVLNWTRAHTERTVDDLTEKGQILTACQDAGVSVAGYCQNTQTLNMNISNNNNRKVDALIVRGFDIYSTPQGGQKNVSLEPQKTKSVSVVKQGVLKRAEVMPVIKVGSKTAVCSSRKITLEPIGFC